MKVVLTIRPTETRDIETDGEDYVTAKAAALEQVPEGWAPVAIRTER
ncbi:hypothetical protein GCM10027416_07950 [Okibacterium endophyticum]